MDGPPRVAHAIRPLPIEKKQSANQWTTIPRSQASTTTAPLDDSANGDEDESDLAHFAEGRTVDFGLTVGCPALKRGEGG